MSARLCLFGELNDYLIEYIAVSITKLLKFLIRKRTRRYAVDEQQSVTQIFLIFVAEFEQIVHSVPLNIVQPALSGGVVEY